MKSELRTKLYEATKENHIAVEKSFNFSDGISHLKLKIFHQSLLRARTQFQKCFHHLENIYSIKTTFNDALINSLKLDITTSNIKIETSNFKNTSYAVGVFYVFAGSAMGARVLRNMALEHTPPIHSNYIAKLIETSGAQMKILETLLAKDNLDESELIAGANEAFATLTKYANNEYNRQHRSIESA